MKQETISIIVTVYNIEEYLPHCLESISKQTYKELDIILVDDGSIDSSGQICDDFAANDHRCRVIHQENQGACMARNAGKKEAKGNYLFFMDGDDYMHYDAIQVMYEAINSNEKKYDISIIGHKRTDNFKESISLIIDKKSYELDRNNMMQKLMGGIDDMELAGYCWNKLYRKTAIDSLFFRQFVPVEDFDFNLRAIMNIQQVIVTPCVLYYYVQRPTSLVHSPKKSWFVWARLTKLLYQNYQELSDVQKQNFESMIIDKLYFIMLFYKETSWRTEHQKEAFSFCTIIKKNTLKSYILNKNISPIKKVYRLLLLHSPLLTRTMMQLRGWKR